MFTSEFSIDGILPSHLGDLAEAGDEVTMLLPWDVKNAADELTVLLFWESCGASLILPEVWEPGVWGILLDRKV